MAHRVKAHEVEAHKIANVQPLLSAAQILSPDAGLLLVLDNGTKHAWVAEKDGAIPATGDFFVRDGLLGVTYAVPAAKFATLFTAR